MTNPFSHQKLPIEIFTSRGMFPTCLLRHETPVEDYEEATIYADEYYIGDELVKRSMHVALKSKDLLVAQSEF